MRGLIFRIQRSYHPARMLAVCCSHCIVLLVVLLGFCISATSLATILDEVLLEHSSQLWGSSVQVSEKYAVPATQGWSRCQNCIIDSGGNLIVVYDTPKDHNVSIEVSWSLWGEFFHGYKNDRFTAKTAKPTDLNIRHRIEIPVFVLPMITLHVGHILVDLLEQIHQAQLTSYGRIRRDCIIVLDVASALERPILDEKIDLQVNTGDEVGSLLSLYTQYPVHSMAFLKQLRSRGGVLFSDLHIGADISRTYYNAGQQSQPCVFSLDHGNAETLALSRRYQEFSAYLRGVAQSTSGTKQPKRGSAATKVLIVQRRANRVILNLEEITVASSDAGYVTEIIDLDEVPFSRQRSIFAHTDVLVSVAGTALHNVLFMRPGSAAVMFMQPMWCEHAWMYANQAVLLGIKPLIYCAPSTPPVHHVNAAHPLQFDEDHVSGSATTEASSPIRHYGWTNQLWLQGPREHKSDNITVDVPTFVRLLAEAARHTEALRNGTLKKTADSSTDGSLEPYLCPGDTHRSVESAHRAAPTHYGTAVRRKVAQSEAGRDRLLEMYLSSVTVEFLVATQEWKVGIVGEIGGAQHRLERLLQSTPHLAVCLQSTATAPWCYPIGAFNYYTELFLHMALPVQGLHIWAQVSTTGGKIRNSDVYVALDCRLPSAGFALHKQLVGRVVMFEVVVHEHCVRSDTEVTVPLRPGSDSPSRTALVQVLTYPTSKAGSINSWSCGGSKRVTFHYKLTSRLSLQRHSADFCLLHAILPQNCLEFVGELSRHLHQQLQAEALSLRPVQVAPSLRNPFFFMHIEKSAGTTLRTYINESAQARGLRAFLPCHTEHCRVFAPPLHQPNDVIGVGGSGDAQASSVDWSDMRDLRLVQPPARNNSNVTVLAGHFDFLAPFRHLPQCQGEDSPHQSKRPWSTHILFDRDPERPDSVALPRPPANPGCEVSCFTVGRHPVDRAISYYYQRFYQHREVAVEASGEASPRPLQHKRINELSPAELEGLVLSVREATHSHFYPDQLTFIDEGMGDAACAAVLGLKFTTGRAATQQLSLPPTIPASTYPQAKSNLQQCVVGLQERWNETLQVLDVWIPWIDFSTDAQRRKMKLYSGVETRHTLRPELHDVLVRLNPCDMMLYEEMQRLFQLQMEIVKARYFV